ncbi:IclR family transcriptional regulator [Rhodococcus sp. NPDC003318]|uniref:IclR family transcriptional regulator n=1 Tax=Rhodococcus sp. NPDC003318 TaxID=3364503 RepID=UPI00368D9E38
MTQSGGYRERNSTADRTLSLLQMFTDDRTEITAADVASSLGVARSTAYRYLESLGSSGFLADTGRGTFVLGFRILELARIARRGYGLSEICRPAMRELALEFKQTVLLTKRMGTSVVCLEREESPQQYIRLSYERGTVLSLNAGASALVLLAWLPESDVRELLAGVTLPRFNRNTLVDVDSILERLAQIRERGYAMSSGEVDPSVQGVACPVFDRDDRVVAAVSVVLIKSMVAPVEVDEITDRLVSLAEELSGQVRLLGQ